MIKKDKKPMGMSGYLGPGVGPWNHFAYRDIRFILY